jgi:hypothetical protein
MVAAGLSSAAMTFDTLSYARRLELAAVEQRLKVQIETLDQRLTAAIDTQSLRFTVRLGLMMAAGFSLMTALPGFLARLH